jgi:transcriptional regulator with XRE-family HTH domain
VQSKREKNSFQKLRSKQLKTENRKLKTMLPDVAPSGSRWSSELVRTLTEPDFRHEYMMDHVRSYIAFQIRALREQRRWNQGDLAKAASKTQSVISRLEDPDYGKLSLQSCLDIAVAYDLPLLVQFVEWDDWLTRMSSMSPSALRKRSFDANRLLELHEKRQADQFSSNDSPERQALQQLGLGVMARDSAIANANDEVPGARLGGLGVSALGGRAA